MECSTRVAVVFHHHRGLIGEFVHEPLRSGVALPYGVPNGLRVRPKRSGSP